MRPIPLRRTVQLDLPTGEIIYTLESDAGEFGGHEMARLEDIELDLGYRFTKRLRIADDDPLTAKTEIVQTVKMRRGDWSVRLESRAQLAAQLDHLHFTAEIQAFEGDEPLRTLTWDELVPRRLF